MTFPIIGLIADEVVKTNFKQDAVKLGIGINFFESGISTEKIIEMSKKSKFICVDPTLISTSSLKSIQRSGVIIYPSISTIESSDKLIRHKPSNQMLSIVVTRSSHAQISTWPLTLITENISITPAPGISEDLAVEIQLSAINLANEMELIGGIELIVDADDFKRLISVNWTNPLSSNAFAFGSITGYFEQYLRAVLDLPLGNTESLKSFIVTGNLTTDAKSDDYRPYLHLMARNPYLKFDQNRKKVGLLGDNLESMLTEIIHAQQYYSGDIEE